MKLFRKLLRYWFAFVSIFSFLAGWAMLAHSLKPIQPSSQQTTTSLTTTLNLPPIQAYGQGTNTSLNSFSSSQQQASFFPRLRTGGS